MQVTGPPTFRLKIVEDLQRDDAMAAFVFVKDTKSVERSAQNLDVDGWFETSCR